MRLSKKNCIVCGAEYILKGTWGKYCLNCRKQIIYENGKKGSVKFLKKYPTYHRDKSRRYAAMDPLKWALKAWQANLKVHYKITHMDYEKLLRGQKGRCAICKSLTPGQNHKHFCIDHSHKTGKIRGLLCHKCNHGIGSFDDKPKLLQQAIYYLKGGK